MAKKDNKLETILIQLEALCTNGAQKASMTNINGEVILHRDVQKKNQNNCDLYSTLHLTRSLDTSLRLFLEINNILGTEHALGDYLKKLVNHHDAALKKLNDGLRMRFQTDIVNQRNRFMHTSGAFPNKSELNNLENSICFCLQTILNLK